MKLRHLLQLALALAAVGELAAQTYTFSQVNNVSLYFPTGIALDASGTIYGSTSFGTVWRMPLNGPLTILAGSNSGSADGTGTAAQFSGPHGVAVDASGNIYVADTGNHTIRKVTPAGVVTTFAGLAGNGGSADGTGSAARFNAPIGLTMDVSGNLFVADSNNHAIRKITPAGVVSTVAGSADATGSSDGTGTAARFNSPQGIAVDSSGNLYVADAVANVIRKVTPAGQVTTLAGLAGSSGFADGSGAAARFTTPNAIAVDAAGNLFVTDFGNYTIRRITPTGQVATIAGTAGMGGDTAGVGATARFYGSRGIAVDSSGSLYVADNYSVKLGTTSSQLAITVQPQSQSVGAGSPAVFSVTATGAAPLSYQWSKNGAPLAGSTQGAVLTLGSVQSGDTGSYSVTVTNSTGVLTSASATLTVLAPVTNDNFASATEINGLSGSIAGANNGATGEALEPTHLTAAATASSVWYKWTPAQSGTVVMDLSSNGFSIAAAAYTGNTLSTLTRVGQASGSRLTFVAQGGTTYYLAVGSYYSGSRGNFTLTWRTITNDAFANAQAITGPTGSVSGNNNGATGEPGEPTHTNPSGTATSIWYRWTPAQNGTAIFDTNGSTTYNVLAVYTGDTLTALTKVAETPTIQSALNRVTFNATAGVTYSIAVGSYGFGTGDIRLNWQMTNLPVITIQPFGGATTPTTATFTQLVGTSVSFGVTVVSYTGVNYQWQRNGQIVPGANNATLSIPSLQASDAGVYTLTITNSAGSVVSNQVILNVLVPPANDNFANAQVLTGLSGTVTGSNVNATGETGEPVHWNLNGTASSVWYRWTATTNGLAVIDTVGSRFDTVLAVYTGTGLSSLTRLVQDDDRGGGGTSQVSFAATSGVTYSIAVGGSTTTARGALTLNWQLSPTLAITTAPASQTVAVGGSATFSVQATGSGVTYQWNRNGVAIPGATNATLNVGNIEGGADASFTVTVTNSTGSVTSAPATLSVAAPTLTTLTIKNQRTGGALLWSIAGGGGNMVAVGDRGTILSSSDNGRTWTPRDSGISVWIVGVTYGGGQFVAVADRGIILTSPDGVTWTSAPSTGTTQRMNNVIYADGKYVAVGEAGTILTSPDARTWTPRTSGVTTWLHGLAYNATIRQFATCGQSGVILYSGDGVTWSRLPVAGLTVDVEAIVAVNSYAQFVAIGHNGTEVSVHQNQLLLKDGSTLTTWTGDTSATGTDADFVGLAQGASALFAAGVDKLGNGKVVTATDDRGPWYTLPAGAGMLLGGLFYNDSLYIVGADETILQSDPLYTSRLINISTRGQVGTGGNIMISGFVVTGDTPKNVLVRAIGPTLGTAFGVTSALTAPVLTVLDGNGNVIGTNTGWDTALTTSSQKALRSLILSATTRVGAFPLPDGSADSVLYLTNLNPGAYTAQVSGANGTTGVALVEAYDADALSNTSSRAINISTRGVVGTGDAKLIAGFVVNGASSRRVLIRAVGPRLGAAPFNLAGTLAQPQLSLYNGKGLLNSTAGAWGLQANADEIRATAKAVGAFDLADGSSDSAMLVTLLPGAWTVQVSGAGNSTGVALVEVYALP